MILKWKVPLCTSKDNPCTNKIQENKSNCLRPCSGLHVTSLSKAETKINFDTLIQEEITSYNSYTKWFEFPIGLKGQKKILTYFTCNLS